LVLSGATIYSSPVDPPIANGVIVVRGGKIVEVGKMGAVKLPGNASVLKCDGMFITSGFQNSHAHFSEDKWQSAGNKTAAELERQLTDMLTRYGVTTVVDTGSMLENTLALRSRIEKGEVKGPRILTAGGPLYPPDGIPFYLKDTLPPDIVAKLSMPATSKEAAATAAGRLEAGADILKLFTGSWVARGKVLNMPVDLAVAAAAEAHKRGKLVFAHASNVAGLEVALKAKVDVLAHALDDDRGWNESHIARMKENHMSMIPTLKLFYGPPYFKYILKEVGDFAAAGGQILFGTDIGYLPDYDPTPEYTLMAEAGLNWKQILASLTTAPAERFQESNHRGRIANGFDADLVVLTADPAAGVNAFSAVKYTIRAGQIIFSN
jgi:imidazolonepropionase-like amidohydrolase